MQAILAADRVADTESRKQVFFGALGPDVRKAIDEYTTRVARSGVQVALFYERHLATLQQFAILYAPENSDSKLETESGRDDLGYALLMTADLMMERPSTRKDDDYYLACRIQDQIRMCLVPALALAGRAFYLYELNSLARICPWFHAA